MPLGAVHAASVEDKIRSERNKRSNEKLYSTGFGGSGSFPIANIELLGSGGLKVLRDFL